ncbi:T9SS type A sorting domain-containing protein [uncultured Draconibacterium sp.]|uniref:T9SS type A sorting domain-containing protein n=1 Tax=uncultured Draconibacterium sp. TaxID=1573823 RepID=UPI00321799C4
MRKMFTKLFGLALLMLLFSAVSVVKAQNHCGPTISTSDVEVVTDLTTVCDGDLVTFQVVGFAGAEFAFNYDGDDVGDFTTDSTFTVNEGDPFRVIVRVNDTCISNEITVQTDVLEPITLLDAEAEHPTCGDSLGEVSINFTGGVGPFTYWVIPIDSFGVAPNDDYDRPTANNGVRPGTYVVTVQDKNKCFDIDDVANWDTVTVNMTTPGIVIDTIGVMDPACFGGDGMVGLVVVDTTGTPASYGFIVDLYDASEPEVVIMTDTTVNDTVVFEGVAPGTYFAIVSDSVGCEATSEEVEIVEPEEVEFEIEVFDVSCAEAGDGAIQVAITNYIAGHEYAAYVESADSVYAWELSDGDSIIDITGLDPVYYALYVKDSTNSCEAVGYVNPNNSGNKITVQSPGEIMWTIVYDSINCRHDSTLVSLDSISGGNGSGLEFKLFEDGDSVTTWLTTTEWLLPAGDYELYSRNSDGDGCEMSEAFEITQPSWFGIYAAETSPSCPGGNDGIIRIGVYPSEARTRTYEYSIDGNTWYDNPVFTTAAGEFEVYARDKECPDLEKSTTAEVDFLDENVLQLLYGPGWTDTANTCYGENDNAIVVGIYTWAQQEDENRELTVFITDDKAEVFVSGDTMTQGFLGNWRAVDVDAGTYYIWAVDNFGCKTEDTVIVTVTQPDMLAIDATVTEHATCNNDNDGVITIKGDGGYPDEYKYGVANSYLAALNMDEDAMNNWPSGADSVEVQAAAGVYYAVLYDDECGTRVISEELEVKSFDPVLVSDTALMVTDMVCYGDSVGVIEINAATGGSGELVYTLWYYEGDTVPGYVEVTDTVFTNLKGGWYVVEVTDKGTAGCDGDYSDPILVDQPDMIYVDAVAEDISCFGAADGLVRLYFEGGNEGTPMFKLGTASWQPMISNDEKSTAFSYDYYKNVVITEPGTYTVWFRDTLGCDGGSETFTVVEPPVLTVDALGIDDTTACGDLDDGMIEVTIEGGKALVSGYEIEVAGVDTVSIPMDSVHTFMNVAPGIYEVYVTELGVDNPCTIMDSVTIDSPDTIAVATVVNHVACKDGETGSIELNITGGSGDYDVSISPVAGVVTDTLISELPAGLYVVTVSDDESFLGECSLTLDTIVIEEPDEYLTLGVTKIQDITCAEPGKFSLQAAGGVGEYVYAAKLSELPAHVVLPPATSSSAWQSDSIFSVTEFGTWVVWVMDENGCITGGEYNDAGQVVNTWRVPIAKPKVEVIVDIDDMEVDCNGDMTAMIVVDDAVVTIEVEEVAEDRGYTVEFTSLAGVVLGSGDTLADLGADTIIVTVLDTLSGCTGVDTVVITEPEVLQAELFIKDGEFSCPDVNEGYIEVAVMGGNVDYALIKSLEKSASVDAPTGYMFQLWQDGVLKTDYQPDNSFLVQIDHDYVVVVKDANDCTDTTNMITIDPVTGPEIVDVVDITCDADTAASVKVVVAGEEGRKFKVVWRQYEVESDDHFGETGYFPAGDIILDQTFKFDNESDDDQHYEIYVVDSMGCVSEKDSMTFDQVISSPLELTVTEGAVSGCGTEVTITAAGGVAPYVVLVDGVEVTEDMVVLGGGMHTIKVMDVHECSAMEEITLAYPMSMDTAIETYTGEAVQFVMEDAMLDTMLMVGEYSFYYAVDTACTAELNVTVTEKDRAMPVLDTVTPMDTIADNHPTFEIVFEGAVTFNDSVMGYLTVTPEDSTEALLMIEITEDMVSGNTITVDYVLGEGEIGLDKNTTYVVAVDSGVVIGDGLAWDGVTGDWMFTTGPDWATDVVNPSAAVEFKVYPNPFNDHIKIENYDKLTRVVLTNIAGQRVLDIEYPSYEIRTGNLVTGVYVVTLIANDEIVKSERIIKR